MMGIWRLGNLNCEVLFGMALLDQRLRKSRICIQTVQGMFKLQQRITPISSTVHQFLFYLPAGTNVLHIPTLPHHIAFSTPPQVIIPFRLYPLTSLQQYVITHLIEILNLPYLLLLVQSTIVIPMGRSLSLCGRLLGHRLEVYHR